LLDKGQFHIASDRPASAEGTDRPEGDDAEALPWG
jgi:hypothetical protein